jgi:hypothetical protein
MTPKEKAKELLFKFVALDNDIFCSVNYPYAKQCALIAVDEILDDDVYDMSEKLFEKRIEYWEEVKQEIERL